MIQLVPIDDLQRGEYITLRLRGGLAVDGSDFLCGVYLGKYSPCPGKLQIGCGFWHEGNWLETWWSTETVESVERGVELDPC